MEASSPFRHRDRAAARATTGLRGDPVLLWTGNLYPNKDPLTILAGLERLLARLPGARLYMAWRYASLLRQVEARIAASETLRPAVTLLGEIPHGQIEAYYNSADFFVQGSAKEGSGIALLDALACGDEVWNLSVAHKLAMEGVFGTDLFAGFSGADQHYFLALPLHHVWQAALFKVLGTGLAQARWVSLLAGMTILWVVSRLAYRWFGLGASLLTGLLLVFWRSDLIGLHPGLPLLAVARWGRHDVGAVAWYWLAVASLYSLLLHPRRIVALAVGMCCGAAALTHFYGAFVIPVVAVAWLWRKGQRALKDPLSYWILLGLALVLGPYVAYVTRHWVEFQGQMLINQNRMDLGDLAFYGDNVLREPRRLAHLVHLPALRRPGYRPLGPWLFWLGIGPAAVYLLVRARSKEALGARLLVLSLVLTWGQLALLEQVKVPLYLVVLVPGVCLALAAFGVCSTG